MILANFYLRRVRNFCNAPLDFARFKAIRVGTGPALPSSMGVSRYRDLFTWQLANAFKTEVHRLLEANAAAVRRWKYRDQLLESAAAVPVCALP